MNRQSWKLSPKAGNIKNLKLFDEEIAEPEAKEIQIEVKAIGLNFADIFAMYGLYGATPEGEFIPGLEYSGVVINSGKSTQFKNGDKVMGVTKFGAYTSVINIDEAYVTLLPEGWSFEEGAAFLVQALTAYWALIEIARIKKGETVLIHSAAGGVGVWANRIAKKMDAYTIGTIGSDRKIDFLKAEGYDDYIVRSDNFESDLTKKLQGRELNVVLECIGGKVFKAGYKKLAKQGRMVVYGSARYAQTGDKPNYVKLILQYITRPKIDPQRMIEQNKSIHGFNLIYLYELKDKFSEILEDLKRFDLGRPHVGHTYDFNDFRKAIKLFQTGKTTGKVVVNVK